MKACKFCGTQVTDQEQRCSSCGSSVFLHICENCGSQFESGFCPNCGVKAGAVKKVCPECRTAYFSNACPNCGYTPARKPAVQEIVHKHVYVEPEPKPAPAVTPTQARNGKKKGKGYGCLTWIIVLLVIGALFGNSSSKKSTTSTTRSSTTRKPSVTATKDPTPTPTPEPIVAEAQNVINRFVEEQAEAGVTFEPTALSANVTIQKVMRDANHDNRPLIEAHKAEYKTGRGKVDTKGIEPDYIGVIGYAAVSEDQKIEKTGDFVNRPWQVPVYQKDKQFWEETGTIEHKTQVVVIDQVLELSGSKYSSSAKYKGYVQVLRLDNGDCFYLNVTNFVTSPYWEKTLSSAMDGGYCIAAFKQTSDYYPVTKGNEKCELEDGTLVLMPMKSTVYASSPDKENNPILGIVFKELKYGYGGVNVFFNESDLTLTY